MHENADNSIGNSERYGPKCFGRNASRGKINLCIRPEHNLEKYANVYSVYFRRIISQTVFLPHTTIL